MVRSTYPAAFGSTSTLSVTGREEVWGTTETTRSMPLCRSSWVTAVVLIR